MADHPVWFVGDRNPAISDTVTINGVAVDLTAKTTTFKMRAVGSSTLKVNQAVSTKDASGNWSYNWGASDLDAESQYLGWVTVDMGGGALETVNEALIEVRAHAPGANAYLELEEFKATAELTGTGHADTDIQVALLAASRGIEEALGQKFWPDLVDAVRYYSTPPGRTLPIDPLISLTSLTMDLSGGDDYGTTLTVDTDFYLAPKSAVADGKPYTSLQLLGNSSAAWPPNCYPDTIKVTGKFGWSAVPAQIKTLTRLIAARLVLKTRQAPFGVVAVGLDGAAVRAASLVNDPEYQYLTYGLNRNRPRV